MAVTTENYYVGDGSTVLFSFTFPYIEVRDVYVSLDGVDQALQTEYTFANATTIEFVTAPAVDAEIRIYRNTDNETIKSVFYPGSAIRARDLNDNFTQNLYVTQEAVFSSDTATADAAAAAASAAQAAADAQVAREVLWIRPLQLMQKLIQRLQVYLHKVLLLALKPQLLRPKQPLHKLQLMLLRLVLPLILSSTPSSEGSVVLSTARAAL